MSKVIFLRVPDAMHAELTTIAREASKTSGVKVTLTDLATAALTAAVRGLVNVAAVDKTVTVVGTKPIPKASSVERTERRRKAAGKPTSKRGS